MRGGQPDAVVRLQVARHPDGDVHHFVLVARPPAEPTLAAWTAGQPDTLAVQAPPGSAWPRPNDEFLALLTVWAGHVAVIGFDTLAGALACQRGLEARRMPGVDT